MKVKPRTQFRGSDDNLTSAARRIITQLGFTNKPLIFTVHNQDYASFFGNPYVVVPTSSFVSLMSEDIRDLKNIESTLNKEHNAKTTENAEKDSQKQIELLAKTYKVYNNQIPYHTNNEVIISTDSYYLLSPKYINKLNLLKAKLPEQISTYKELVDKLKISFGF